MRNHPQNQSGGHLPTQPQQQYPLPMSAPRQGLIRAAQFLQMIGMVTWPAFGMLLFIAVLELAMPFNFKPSVIIGTAAGTMDAVEMRTKLEDEADYRAALAEAQALAERTTQAYIKLYERVHLAVDYSYRMQQELFQTQMDNITNGQTGGQIASIILDGACNLSGLDPSIAHWRQHCGQGERIRRANAKELASVMEFIGEFNNGFRDDMLSDLPDPAMVRVMAAEGGG